MKYKKQIKFLKESLNKWKIKNFKSDFRRKKENYWRTEYHIYYKYKQ